MSADTEYPELAAEIISWLSYELSCYQPENATFKIDEGDAKNKISAVSQDILNLYSDKADGGIAWDSLMTSDKADIWLDVCAGLFERRINTEGFIDELKNSIG